MSGSAMTENCSGVKRARQDEEEQICEVNVSDPKFSTFYASKLSKEPAYCAPLSSVQWELRKRTQKLSQELNRDFPIAPIPQGKALAHSLWATCGRARAGCVSLPHGPVETPVFMPVGTQAVIKGISPEELSELDIQIILNNTYHLANRPGCETLDEAGGSHKFMRWRGNILTDSGGFQMVSLLKLAQITEEGVEFEHPSTGQKMLLTPEKSIESQNSIGSDIMMQLDDVIDSCTTDRERFEIATERTFRWLDRCIKAHARPESQNLFGIVQGGLFSDLREISLKGMKERDLPGYAIGGLSGGESKDVFWRIVEQCTRPGERPEDEPVGLPANKPRYLMGVGYALDIIMCVSLGVDMFDCVFPCRTARFGTALVSHSGGNLRVKQANFAEDPRPLDDKCPCSTCKNYSRAALHHLMKREGSATGRLLTIHNLVYLSKLLEDAREAIIKQKFPEFVVNFLRDMFPQGEEEKFPCPLWVKNCMMYTKIIPEEDINALYDWDKANVYFEQQEERRTDAKDSGAPKRLKSVPSNPNGN